MFTRFCFTACSLLFAFLLFSSWSVSGQFVTGTIVDEQNEPVPYATIFVPETREGTVSNADGMFRLQLSRGEYSFVVRSMGFVQTTRTVYLSSDSLHLELVLKRQEFQIKEVKIFPGEEDPAYFIMRKAIARAPYYRKKVKHYEAELYVKSNFAFSNIPRMIKNSVEVNGKKLKEMVKENVTYVIESQNHIRYDYPNTYKQEVISKKTSFVGFDEPPVMGMITASFYEERPTNVISPLSAQAMRHYTFRYEGFITSGKHDVFKIRITPKRKSDELVEGYLYIIDQLWCIYYLDFQRHFEVFDLRIQQQYENMGNGNWLPVSHAIEGTISALGLKGQFYYGTSLKYSVVTDNQPIAEQGSKPIQATLEKEQPENEKIREMQEAYAEILNKDELRNSDLKKAARINRRIQKEQFKDTARIAVAQENYTVESSKDSLPRNDAYWDTVRSIPLTPAEIRSYRLMDSLVATQKTIADTATAQGVASKAAWLSKILTGSRLIDKANVILRYDGLIAPKNLDFNAVDGYKYGQSAELKLRSDSGKHLTVTPEIGYAFNRKALYGTASVMFTGFLDRGNVATLGTGSESRDFKPREHGIAPAVNAISSWLFAQNYMKLYQTTFLEMDLSQVLTKNIRASAGAAYNHFRPLENHASYLFSDKKNFAPNVPGNRQANSEELAKQKSFEYYIGLHYFIPALKPWLTTSPFLFIEDFIRVDLRYRQGLKNVFSSVSDFSQIEFSMQQQASVSPTAGIVWQLNAGHFFNHRQLHFSQYKHFSSARSPVLLQPFGQGYHLPGDYDFSTNKSYVDIGGELRCEYLLLRYLSFINTKTWSESIHLNTLKISDNTNYLEIGYSLNNLWFIGNIGIFAGFTGTNPDGVRLKISISSPE